ncbi:MAG: hypothetical protein ACYCYP_12750 [Leptospirales bacterium]
MTGSGLVRDWSGTGHGLVMDWSGRESRMRHSRITGQNDHRLWRVL